MEHTILPWEADIIAPDLQKILEDKLTGQVIEKRTFYKRNSDLHSFAPAYQMKRYKQGWCPLCRVVHESANSIVSLEWVKGRKWASEVEKQRESGITGRQVAVYHCPRVRYHKDTCAFEHFMVLATGLEHSNGKRWEWIEPSEYERRK